MLNKAITFVRQIHPENGYQDNHNRFNNRYQEDDQYDNRNYSDKHQNNDWNDYMRNDSYDSSRDEDRQHNYRRDDHRNRNQDFSPPRDNGRQQYKRGRYQNKQNNQLPKKIFNKPNPPICSQFVRDLHQDLDEGIEELSIWEQQEAHCGLLYEQKLIGSPDFFLEYTDLNCQS
mgnify:CR=1 FL=1